MLKRNTVANFAGQGWAALMSLAFVPLYIQYLGIEAYGVIGLFVMLQAWLVLLDLGMTPTINREMARFTAGQHTSQEIRDLLRSLEIVAGTIAVIVALAIAGSAPLIANGWVKIDTLDPQTVTQAVAVMGLVMATRLLESLYRSSLIGLQRQVLYNVVFAVTATLRGGGVVIVLVFWSSTLEAFFLWQAMASLVSLAVLSVVTYATLPKGERRAHFSVPALRGIGRFAGGMVLITLLSLLLMQADKLLLSTLLPLDEFGRYALATAVAGGLTAISVPIAQAWFPRMSQLHAAGDFGELGNAFHKGAQLISIATGSAAIFLMAFAEQLLWIWTGDAQLASSVAPLLSLLALGNLLHAMNWIPYYTQLAFGWTRLAIYINIAAVLVIVPAILVITPRYGAIGAACIWVALNVFYVLLGAQIMFRKILKGELQRWYTRDLAFPLAGAGLAALLLQRIVPFADDVALTFVGLVFAAFATVAAASVAAPDLTVPVLKGMWEKVATRVGER